MIVTYGYDCENGVDESVIEHKTNKKLKQNVTIHVYHVHVTSSTIPYVLKYELN